MFDSHITFKLHIDKLISKLKYFFLHFITGCSYKVQWCVWYEKGELPSFYQTWFYLQGYLWNNSILFVFL